MCFIGQALENYSWRIPSEYFRRPMNFVWNMRSHPCCCATFHAKLRLKSLNLFDLCDLGAADFWHELRGDCISLADSLMHQIAFVSFQFPFGEMLFMNLCRREQMENVEPLQMTFCIISLVLGAVSIDQREMSKMKIATGITQPLDNRVCLRG